MPNSGISRAGAAAARAHVAPLTSLRFFAALYVVVYHNGPEQIRATGLGGRFMDGGYIGVSFFFVLSGFVLGWNYLDRFAQGAIRRSEFWRARFARIYPVYVLGLLVSAPYFILRVLREQGSMTAAAAEFGRSAGLTLTLTQSWLPRYWNVWNGPSWSLSVEAFFYALFPLLAVAVMALPRRRIIPAICVAWAVSLIAPALYVAFRPAGAAYPLYDIGGFWIDAVRYMPAAHLEEFIIGLLGARWLLDRTDAPRSDVSLRVVGLALVGLALVMFAAYPLFPFLHDGLLAPLFLGVILLLAQGEGPVVRFLASPVLVLLGEASYALYLLHLPLGAWMSILGKRVGVALFPGASIGAFALYLPLCLVVSVVVLRYVEEPARRAIRQGRLIPIRLRRSAPTAASTPAAAVSSE